MSENPRFWPQPNPLTLERVCTLVGGELSEGADARALISGVGPLDQAGAGDITFLDNIKYISGLEATSATACLISPKHAAKAPKGLALVITPEPYRALGIIAAALFPLAMRISGTYEPEAAEGIHGTVHPTAQLEADVRVEPGAIIGAGAEIGAGTIINAGAIIGYGVKIGRECSIGPGAYIGHALIGNHVNIHAGARIGQDGFGFAMGASHLKMPQLGRVIIQDHVEIGANTCIDRGAVRDTIIGEGTKIDNQVQIAHNVEIGRNCVIVSHCGISGSTHMGDYVVLGGKVGTAGHLKIGDGAQIAGGSNLKDDIPAGQKWGGTPAQPFKNWARELAALKMLAQKPQMGQKNPDQDE